MMFRALFAVFFAVLSPLAVAQTAYTALGGNLYGQYCYDFGNYIPSVDSPVTGGYVPYGYVADRAPGAGGGSFWAYGVVCFNIPYGGPVDPNNNANMARHPYYLGTAFYADPRVAGLFWSGKFVYDSSSSSYIWAVAIEASCPRNSAMISVPGYKRSDGVDIPPLNYYSSAGGVLAQGNAAMHTGVAARRHAVCVKTDTQ